MIQEIGFGSEISPWKRWGPFGNQIVKMYISCKFQISFLQSQTLMAGVSTCFKCHPGSTHIVEFDDMLREQFKLLIQLSWNKNSLKSHFSLASNTETRQRLENFFYSLCAHCHRLASFQGGILTFKTQFSIRLKAKTNVYLPAFTLTNYGIKI